MNFKFTIFAVAFLANSSSLMGGSIMLMSDLGEVINLSASLRDKKLSIRRLAQIQGILSVTVDPKNGLLYVVSDSLPVLAKTNIYSLKSLKLVGVLPGVTHVQIPKQADADYFVTVSQKFSAEPGLLSEIIEVGEQLDAVYQVRSRQHPRKVITSLRESEQTVNLSFLNGACYRTEKSGFADYASQSWFTQELQILGRPKGDDRSAKLIDDRILDCTREGLLWTTDAFARTDAPSNIRLISSEKTHDFLLPKIGFSKLRALGENAAVVFNEDIFPQDLTVIETDAEPVKIKLTSPLKGPSQSLYELGWDNQYKSIYFGGGRRIKGGNLTRSNQLYHLSKESKSGWTLVKIDLDRIMLMYLEHRRNETIKVSRDSEIVTRPPELLLEGNEEEFRIIKVL